MMSKSKAIASGQSKVTFNIFPLWGFRPSRACPNLHLLAYLVMATRVRWPRPRIMARQR
jgi:hypothetical protein